jgi:hypothetical protein
VIFADALPKIKTFLRPAHLAASTRALLVRFMAACVGHVGPLSGSAAAEAIRAEARHRSQLTRFLARRRWSKDWAVLHAVAGLLLQQEARRDGTWLFLLDQTHVGHQGHQAENTFSRGNHKKRPKKGNRKQKKYARRSCHCFVHGLLITPGGLRIPSCRFYYTEDYCKAKKIAYKKQPELAAQLIEAVAVPAGARVVVLGDTAFEAKAIRVACARRDFRWVVPINPERVLAGPKPRAKVKSLQEDLSAEHFEAVRLVPGQGAYAAQERAALCRQGRKAKVRTYWVHAERRAVHNVGDALLVFSTKEQPQPGQKVRVQKVLISDGVGLCAADVVTLYTLRWQIELFFKELKSTLGFAQYRVRRFEAVEGWVQACLVTFCYLEWLRALHLADPDLSAAQRRWWQSQRSYGLTRVARQQADDHDLAQLLRWSGSKTGLRKLRHALRQALPVEYRQPA